MKRFHLFEFEDQAWCPSWLRNYVTDFLQTVAEKFGMFDPVIPRLEKLIEESDLPVIVDLASGAGGQWRTLLPKLQTRAPEVRLCLTDKFPNDAALRDMKERFGNAVAVETRPVDAADVPQDLRGIRTMFLSLHHFKPEEVKGIFENAVRCGAPIAVFEAQRRDIEHVIRFSLSPIGVLLLTPLIRPFRFARVLFTYFIPLVPLVVFWDGVVSVFRTYKNDELKELAESVDPEKKFQWSGELILNGQQKIQVFTGQPR